MKDFFKYLMATITGIVIFHIVAAILILIFIFSLSLFSTTPTYSVKPNSILKISLAQHIPDRASENPIESLDFFSMTIEKQLGLNTILSSIEKAAIDNQIVGIYLDLTDISAYGGSFGTVEEIRNALLEFKKSGKFIYSYSNPGYSQTSYYLASVADSLFVNPQAPLLLYGLNSGVLFYKESLERLGIKPEIIRVGKFKSAIEPFIDTQMSDANREQLKTYLNSLWGNLSSGIAVSRNISEERINNLVNNFKIYSTKEFIAEGFFDKALYEDEMLDRLKIAAGLIDSDKLNIVSLENYQYRSIPKIKTESGIAVIYASGEIGMKQSSTSIGPQLAQTIRKAREDKNIKAIVLRVNSPGGSALISDIIWREVQLAAAVKPTIASMGNVAASGGYYISCAANKIVADPSTLTGSIGIFGLMFSGEELIKDKLGLHTDMVKTHEHSDFGGFYPLPIPISNRPMTPYEREVMQEYINEGYETFLNRVALGRGMTRDEVNEIGEGRIWSGKDALSIGLIDRLGGISDAIKDAAEEANIDHYHIVELPIEKNLFEELFSNLYDNIKSRVLKEELGECYNLLNRQKSALEIEGAVARIPFDLIY